MTSFEAGFVKYAEEYGCSLDEATYILKRATEYPGTQEMFKQLPDTALAHTDPGEMEQLTELLRQHQIDDNLRKVQ